MPNLAALKSAVNSVDVIRSWRERRYERHFVSLYGSFRGVFDTFAAAEASAPTGKTVGYSAPEFSAEYLDRLGRIFDYDYPFLFWLKCLLRPGIRVFDVGGHVGIHYFAYQKYLEYPADLRWTVSELPEIVKAGAKLASERRSPHLSFTTRLEDGEGADILIAAGSLHYMQTPRIADVLGGYARRPTHLLFNKLPLRDGPTFVTLQNAGVSFVPQYVFSRAEFIDSVEASGYALVDRWSDRIHSCHIPFHRDRAVDSYSGLYFKRREAEANSVA